VLRLPSRPSRDVAGCGALADPRPFADPDRLTKLESTFPAIDSLVADFVERWRVPDYAYGIIVDGRVARVRTARALDQITEAYETVGGTVTTLWRRLANGPELEVTAPANAGVWRTSRHRAETPSWKRERPRAGSSRRNAAGVVYLGGSGRYCPKTL
jgi:hypothetical protein